MEVKGGAVEGEGKGGSFRGSVLSGVGDVVNCAVSAGKGGLDMGGCVSSM